MRNGIATHCRRGIDRSNVLNALLWAGLLLTLAVVPRGTSDANGVIPIAVAAATASLTLTLARHRDGREN